METWLKSLNRSHGYPQLFVMSAVFDLSSTRINSPKHEQSINEQDSMPSLCCMFIAWTYTWTPLDVNNNDIMALLLLK